MLHYFAPTPHETEQLRELYNLISTQSLDETTSACGAIHLIYAGRNRLYRVEMGGQVFVVKCFAKPNALRRLYYSTLGTSKAERSHRHALTLSERGVAVAKSLGYIEERNAFGLIGDTYYVAHDLEATVPNIQAHARGWAAPSGFMPALATYLASAHRAGVEHLDLSPGNILYRYDGVSSTYSFAMVDLNRMRFHRQALDRRQSLKNLCRLMNTRSTTRRLAADYATCRGWDKDAFIRDLEAQTDAFWLGRLLKLSIRYCHRHYGMGGLGFTLRYLRYRWALLRGHQTEAGRIYREILQREDIRHIERHRRGFTYQYTN